MRQRLPAILLGLVLLLLSPFEIGRAAPAGTSNAPELFAHSPGAGSMPEADESNRIRSLGAVPGAASSLGLPDAPWLAILLLGLAGLGAAGSRPAPARDGEAVVIGGRRSALALGPKLVALLLVLLPSSVGALPIGGLVISEVFYNPVGGDDQREWVEIFNGTGADIDLSSYSLGWGGPDYAYGTLQLSGIIGAGQYFVVGGPISNGTNGNPVYDQVADFAPDIQDGTVFVADGVALFDVTAASITPATVPIDAVLYGWPFSTNANGLVDETGLPAPVDVFNFGGGGSIAFDGATWSVQAAPSPNAGPLTPAPTPPAAAALLVGLALVGTRLARDGH